MISVRLVRAQQKHAGVLTEISTESFISDSLRHNPFGKSGPEGYDSIAFQQEHIKKDLYYLIEADGEIAGGLLLRKTDNEEHMHVPRVFIGTFFQNRGIGKRAFYNAEKLYPCVKTWTLDTPSWAVRNHHFYESVGYKKTREFDVEGILFSFFFYVKKI